MAFTGSPASGANFAKLAAHEMVSGGEWGAKKRGWDDTYTHTLGAGVGEVNLVRLPPGKHRILIDQCRIVASQMVATADLHLGYRAYTKSDGTAVVEDDNAFADNLDVGGAAIDQAWVLPAVGYFDVDSKTDFIIYAMIDTANMEDTDTIYIHVETMSGD